MSRGEIQAFLSSLHVISSELSKANVQVPARVAEELEAMEHCLRADLDEYGKKKKF